MAERQSQDNIWAAQAKAAVVCRVIIRSDKNLA